MSIVAVYDSNVGGAVVVRSHIRDWVVGDIIFGVVDKPGHFRVVSPTSQQSKSDKLKDKTDSFESDEDDYLVLSDKEDCFVLNE
jgi:hypothetical protein